jgi:archaellum biogenesis protein FlaJ (TadC family)
LRFYEAIAIIFLYILSFVFGIFAKVNHLNPHPFIATALLIFFLTYSFGWIYRYLEASSLRYATKKLLYMGRGIPRSLIKTQVVVLELSVIAIISIASYMVLAGPRIGFPPILPVVLAAFIATLGISLAIVRIRSAFTISSRKTSVEVELPFLLALMRALSETHLSLYDLLSIIEKSAALRAWAREIHLAKRMSAVMNVSLLQAIATLADTHPSATVRDIFKRIVTVGNLAGTIREVVDRAFSYVFERLESRLTRLTEKLDILNGVMMFAFMFLPIILVTVTPIMGQSVVDVLAMSIIIEVPGILVIYAFLSHMYPSGFVMATPRTLLFIAALSMSLIILFSGIYLQPIVAAYLAGYGALMNTRIEPGLSEYLFYLMVGLTLLPVVIYSELWFSKVKAYTALIRVATDAADTSASLGENFATVFERLAMNRGEKVARLARSIIEGYRSEVFRKAIVLRAPSTFHASFIETLLYALVIGAPPKVLKSLTKSYEILTNLWERTSRISGALEGMIVSLGGMIGFFIKYLEKMFTGLHEMLQQASQVSGTGFVAAFQIFRLDVNVYAVVTTITLLSLIIVSLFTGKTRGGSLVYGFRTSLMSFLVYVLVRIAVDLFVESPIPAAQ